MAFFMVMWIMGMDQPTREVIAGYFKDPIGFDKSTPKSAVNLVKNTGALVTSPGRNGQDSAQKAELNVVRSIQQRLQEAISKDPTLKALQDHNGIELRVTPDGLEVELVENETNSELFFKLGSAEVRPQAKSVLARLAPILGATGRKMMVDGHTDARPLSRAGYDNFDLSHDRANAVRRLLVADGCGAGQFIAVRGFADNQLRLPTDPNHFSNRRVTILIPYSFAPAKLDGLPADVNRESIEGMFKMPKLKPDDPGIKP
jgi:chemotaxis protein MotB